LYGSGAAYKCFLHLCFELWHAVIDGKRFFFNKGFSVLGTKNHFLLSICLLVITAGERKMLQLKPLYSGPEEGFICPT